MPPPSSWLLTLLGAFRLCVCAYACILTLTLLSLPPPSPPFLFPSHHNKQNHDNLKEEEEEEEEQDAATLLLASDPSRRLRELGVGGLDVAFQDIFRR